MIFNLFQKDILIAWSLLQSLKTQSMLLMRMSLFLRLMYTGTSSRWKVNNIGSIWRKNNFFVGSMWWLKIKNSSTTLNHTLLWKNVSHCGAKKIFLITTSRNIQPQNEFKKWHKIKILNHLAPSGSKFFPQDATLSHFRLLKMWPNMAPHGKMWRNIQPQSATWRRITLFLQVKLFQSISKVLWKCMIK